MSKAAPSPQRYTITLDDDPAVHRLIAKFTGMVSLPFTSTDGLIAQAKRLSPRAIFLDVHLADGSVGLDAVARLKEQFPYRPVLVISADDTDEVIAAAFAAGADDFLAKPLTRIHVQARLAKRLADSEARLGERLREGPDFILDEAARTIQTGSHSTDLSEKAVRVLGKLLDFAGTLVGKASLMAAGWGQTAVSQNSLDQKIREIRKALGAVGSAATIKSKYGKGFILAMPPPNQAASPDWRQCLPAFASATLAELWSPDEPDFVREVLTSFLNAASKIVGDLQDTQAAAPYQERAHSLKGMCLNLGLAGLAQRAKALESQYNSDNIKALSKEFASVSDQVTRYLKIVS